MLYIQNKLTSDAAGRPNGKLETVIFLSSVVQSVYKSCVILHICLLVGDAINRFTGYALK